MRGAGCSATTKKLVEETNYNSGACRLDTFFYNYCWCPPLLNLQWIDNVSVPATGHLDAYRLERAHRFPGLGRAPHL